MIQLPKSGVWTQPNVGDSVGDIWASFNIDLSENEGKVRIGKRMMLNTSTADVAEITGVPVGFRYYDGKIFTVAGASGTGYIFQNAGNLTNTFGKATDGYQPTNCDSTVSDLEILDGVLYVTTKSNSVYYATSATGWLSPFTAGASDVSPHLLTAYAGRMYMTRASSNIISWDTSRTVATSSSYTLQLNNSESNVITFMRSASNRIWIGTVNTTGGKGYIYEWDGVSTQTTKSYRLESAGALACVIKDDIPYVMDSDGKLLAWNGGTFKELASLNRKNHKPLFKNISSVNDRFIHPNGMTLVRGRVTLLIDGTNYDVTSHNGTQEETIPSGVYEYDPNKGLVHKHAISPLKSTDTITGYGQTKIYAAGAISEINIGKSSPIVTDGSFLAGAGFYTSATATAYGVFYNNLYDTYQKAGSLISSKLYAVDNQGRGASKNTWQKIDLLYRKLLTASDKVVVKYRTTEEDPVTATITWASTTSFTVANSAVDVSDYWTVGTGGEVEILAGVGGGKCAHITNAVLDSGTWTVTVDETYTGATGTALARFQNWVKCGIIEPNSNTSYSATVDKEASWIQFKVWALFTGKDEFEKFLIRNVLKEN